MSFIKCLIFVTAFSLPILTGCGGSNPENANKALPNANSAANSAKNSDGSLAAVTPTPEQTSNNAPTLTPVYKAYCDAMTKKDEAALRKIYSRDTLRLFEADMKADGVKSLTEFLSTDQVSNKLCEVRNEQIQNETAIAEIRAEGYPNGIKVVFVKENGEWKLTNKSPDVDAVRRSAANSNAAK